MIADRLIRACREDTAILTSFLGWLEEERRKVLERAIKEQDDAEVHRYQGEARKLHELRGLLGQMVKERHT